MAAKDNRIFSVIVQLSNNFSATTPEAVLYGCAKLLSMSEAARKGFLDDEDIAELEKTRRVFADEKIEIELVKNGSPMLKGIQAQSQEEKDKYYQFEKYLAECNAQTLITDIMKKAIACAIVPLKRVYGPGRTLDDLFEYLDEVKARTPKESSAPAKAAKSEEKKEEKQEEVKKVGAEIAECVEVDEASENDVKATLGGLSEKYRKLSAALYDVVKGQDHAIAKFVQGCYQGELLKGLEKKKQPQAYFFFFGPPGVGKTFLAETAAENLGRPYRLFNMSEYSNKSGVDVLLGISTMYKDAKEGILLEQVRKHPNSVLIFDEIEKSDIAVIRLFLQILGSGKAFNVNRDEDTSFEDTIIIFTSNVGKELYADRSVNLATLPESVILSAIQQEKGEYGQQLLPNEICSRIASGNMIMFNHLSVKHLAEMVKNNFDRVVSAMEERYDCRITYAHVLPLLFLYNRGNMDARVASNQSANFMKSEIFELTRHLNGSITSEDGVKSIHFDVDWQGMDEELSKLFVNDTKTELLVLADESVQDKFQLDPEKYQIHFAKTLAEAREYLKQDIVATFIDPFYGKLEDSSNILSITDYNTEGVKFFYELAETETDMNIYLLEVEKEFTEVDRKTFVQIGATATMPVREAQVESFVRLVEQTLDDVYMEKVSSEFTKQGWVIGFKSKQNITADGKLTVLFYDLKKRQAIDSESRDVLLSEADRPKIHFDDVIGARNAKEELKYFVEYLKNPKRFMVNGGRPPKGVLLYGPPGTGKTMLAKAMAGEGGVTFIETSASEFMNKYVGESEANVRRLFAKARKYAPAIIFIDEIDAIGKQRTGADIRAATESVLNALLTEMDGFTSDNRKPVFVLAATNYGVSGSGTGIGKLDEALMRRFDNKIYVDLPNKEERLAYLKMMIAKKKGEGISEEVMANVADRTTGQSLAILQNIINLAFREAQKKNRPVDGNDLLTALEDYMYGEKRERTPEYYRSVAIHEVGHAYVSYLSGDKPSYITIESRGDFGGYMQHSNQENVTTRTREDFIALIRCALAGRASEIVFYDEKVANNTGARSDLERATHYAFLILCAYGMEPGQLMTLSRDEIMKSSLAGEYVQRVNAMLQEEMKNTIAIIEKGRDTIQRIVDVLVAQNHLTGEEFAKLMGDGE